MSIKEMNAITVADDLVGFLENHQAYSASVHSVFPHAVNLLVGEDELITLTNQDDITPMGLTVACGTSFVEFLKAGDEVVLSLDQFRSINQIFSVNLQYAEIWETRSSMSLQVRPVADFAEIRLKLVNWLSQQPALGLLPLLPLLTRISISNKPAVDNIYSRYIAPELEAFTEAINASRWEQALALTDRLVGFGMGSTPSCDDFLAAYLVVFNIADTLFPGRLPWIFEFNQTIAARANNRTTLLSANMLRHAADGKTSMSHQRLIQACLFNDNGDLEHLASRVLEHGATSGGDFLLGLICALEWVQNTITDLLKEGEEAWVALKQLQPVQSI